MSGSSVALAAVNLVFYILCIAPTAYCFVRVAVARRSGWYFIILLTLMRIIGEPMSIVSGGNLELNDGVSVGGYVLASIGLSPLLLAAGGLVLTLNQAIGANNSRIPPAAMRLWGLVPLAALVVSIIGGTDLTSSDPDKFQTGLQLRTAATALYIVTWVLLVVLTAFSLPAAPLSSHRAPVLLAYGVVPSLPFLAVRLIYQALTTFGSIESQLAHSSNIWEKAFLGSLMEWICVIIFVGVGCYAGRVAPMSNDDLPKHADTPAAAQGTYRGAGRDEEYGTEIPLRK